MRILKIARLFASGKRNRKKTMFSITETRNFLNPVIEKKPMRTLDNMPSPELNDYIADLRTSGSISDILKEITNDKPIFSSKNTAFASIQECLKFLVDERVNFQEKALQYLERLYLTLIVSKPFEVKNQLLLEENQRVLKELYDVVKEKPMINPFHPKTCELKRPEFKELIEIPEVAPFLVYVISEFIDKNSSDYEIRRLLDVLRAWDELFVQFLGSKEHGNRLLKALNALFREFNASPERLSLAEKLRLCQFMRFAKYTNSGFLDYINIYCGLNFDRLELSDIIHILYTTNRVQRTIPYELLYRARGPIMRNIKRLSTKNLFRVVEVYSKKKVYFMETFLESLFGEIAEEKNFNALSMIELVLLLYHYSNSRFREEMLFERILEGIAKIIGEIRDGSYINLIMLSLAHLNFRKQEFFEKIGGKINVREAVENIKKTEDLYEDEKEYFKILMETVLQKKEEVIQKD